MDIFYSFFPLMEFSLLKVYEESNCQTIKGNIASAKQSDLIWSLSKCIYYVQYWLIKDDAWWCSLMLMELRSYNLYPVIFTWSMWSEAGTWIWSSLIYESRGLIWTINEDTYCCYLVITILPYLFVPFLQPSYILVFQIFQFRGLFYRLGLYLFAGWIWI